MEYEVVTTDTGIAAQFGRLVIQGNSERTVADVLSEQGHTRYSMTTETD
jgi:translation initiation factor 1 (eIF-1/SUI1)